jgi:RHS repeat-associated protein
MSTTYHSYYGQYVLTGNAEIQVPIMDHMGNVRHYIQLKSGTVNQGYGNIGTMIGQVSANLEYDAFGREVRVSSLTVPPTGTPPGLVAGGLYADALPFHFSTKFTDPESGLNYYGYRFYDSRDGRWLSRDPIEEEGGLNLYGFCLNEPTGWVDILGLGLFGPNCSGSQDESAKKATDKWNPRSIKQDREHCGMVCKKCKGGNDCFFTTHTTGTIDGCTPHNAPCPKGTTEVASWHTHGGMVDKNKDGKDDRGYDNENFSDDDGTGSGDKPYAKWRGHPIYLGTPLGKFKRYDPGTGKTAGLGNVRTQGSLFRP